MAEEPGNLQERIDHDRKLIRETTVSNPICKDFYTPDYAWAYNPETLNEWRFHPFVLDSIEKLNYALDRQLHHGDSNPTIVIDNISYTKETIRDFIYQPFTDTERLPTQTVLKEFFLRHKKEYLDSIYAMAQSVNREEKERHLNHVPQKILLAAKNETELSKAIQAVLDTGIQEDDVHFVIFHNFSSDAASVPSDVQEEIKRMKALSYVSVIEKQLPYYSNAGYAKKYLSDVGLILSYIQRNESPMMFIDGDVTGLTQHLITSANALLEDKTVLAATVHYDYDPESYKRFPLWGIRQQFSLAVRRNEQVGRVRYPQIIGPCFFITPRTLALLGGLTPFINGDLTLSKQATDSVETMIQYMDPVRLIEDGNATVQLNPSREFEHILHGQLPELHWIDTEEQHKITGSKRLDWKVLPYMPSIPLLKEDKDIEPSDVATVFNEVCSLQYALFLDDEFNVDKAKEYITYLLLYSISQSNCQQYMKGQDLSILLSNGNLLMGTSEIEEYASTIVKPDGSLMSFEEAQDVISGTAKTLVTIQSIDAF